MDGYFFAHNGVDHANGIEAAAHGSNTFLVVVSMSVVIAAVLYGTKRFLDNQSTEEIEEEED